MPQLSHLGSGSGQVARVIDRPFRKSSLLFQRHLRGQPGLCLLPGEPVALPQARDLGLPLVDAAEVIAE